MESASSRRFSTANLSETTLIAEARTAAIGAAITNSSIINVFKMAKFRSNLVTSCYQGFLC